MDLIDELTKIGRRADSLRDTIQTEEATKQSLIIPFIQALGYDVYNPQEVCPEYTSDFGTKSGEKVDYAILLEGVPRVFIECKKLGGHLAATQETQLLRYFNAQKEARIAFLTDGFHYKVYSDLEDPNMMDKTPFCEFSLTDITESTMALLKKISKSTFDLENFIESAAAMKMMNGLKSTLVKEMDDPSFDFVKFLVKSVQPNKLFTNNVYEEQRRRVKRAFYELVFERAKEKLQSAMQTGIQNGPEMEEPVEPVEEQEVTEKGNGKLIVTTPDETQGYYLVKAILMKHVDPERIAERDTQSYFGILLDDNNRKPICRLWLNTSQWYLGVFDEEKREERIPIQSLNEIYQYADRLIATVKHYDGVSEAGAVPVES